MVKRAAAVLILVLATFGGVVAPAFGQQPEPSPGDVAPRSVTAEEMREARAIPGGLADDTLRYLLLEVALIEELGAFAPTNFRQAMFDPTTDFELIHSRYGRWPDTDHEKLLAVLDAVDTELATRLSAFRLLGDASNPLLDFAVGRLPADWRVKLSLGDTEFITGFEYAGAIRSLIASDIDPDVVRSGEPFAAGDALILALSAAVDSLADAEELNRLLSAEVADLQAEVAALADAPRAGDSTQPATSWTTWIVAGGGGLVVFLLLAIGVTTRRAARRRAGDHVKTDAMEAHRLLSATRTEADVAAVAAEIGVGLTGAHGAAVLRRTPDGLRPAGQADVLISSGLSRIVEAGQALDATLSNDPFLPGIDAAVVGVPVVNNGSVIGVLMAMIDELTSLGNRRRLDGDLESTLAEAVASDLPVGFAMIDVDHFKAYNDTHGHTAGDVALQNVAATIAACVRDSDVVYRYGGEEFSMLLPGATPQEVVAVAERVRAAVEALDVVGEHLQPSGKLTVSVGVATLESGGAGDIKERADAALYRAKSGGRNTVVVD